jgi:hypothetical protein
MIFLAWLTHLADSWINRADQNILESHPENGLAFLLFFSLWTLVFLCLGGYIIFIDSTFRF